MAIGQQTILFQNLNKNRHIISSCECTLENKAKFKTVLLLIYQDKGYQIFEHLIFTFNW